MSGTLRAFTISLTAFLTVVDLFATQAILPSLTRAYGVTPAAMGFAVNASTIGMAIGGLAVGLFGRSIDRRRSCARRDTQGSARTPSTCRAPARRAVP